MEAWLRAKLDKLAKDYRGGSGFPLIFESQYLCYLECYAKIRGTDPSDFWVKYKADCQKDTPKGQRVLGHYNRILGRDDLADRVLQFRAQFEGPKVAIHKITEPKPEPKPEPKKRKRKSKVQKPEVARIDGGDVISDLFDLFR